MSFLNTTHEVKTISKLPPHITKAQVISLLHNDTRILDLNPSEITYTLLPPSTATQFYSTVPAAYKPPTIKSGDISSFPVWDITEHQATYTDDGQAQTKGVQGGHWKGNWITRFVPNELTYRTSVQHIEDGIVSITNAPMGVQSVTTWLVQDPPSQGEGCILVKTGKVSSNRALMPIIKGGLQGSHDKLSADFVVDLEKFVAELQNCGTAQEPETADGAAGAEVVTVS